MLFYLSQVVLCTIKVKVITIKMRMISLIHINNMAAISFPPVKNIHAVYLPCF